MALRYGIPELGLPVVQIIDRVEIHIFDMPRESGPPHAKVKVRRVDTWDLNVQFIAHFLQHIP